MEKFFMHTGNILSTDVPLDIPVGTDPAAMTAIQQNAKRRIWRLDTTGDAFAANLPENHYRGRLQIDATKCTADATIFFSGDITGNSLITTRHQTIPAGSLWELPFPIDKGALQVALNASATSSTPCIVMESSFD